MISHGFVELQDGSDATLRRILTLSCRWSRIKQVYVWSAEVPRARVEEILRAAMAEHGGRVAAVEIIDADDRRSAVLRAETASFCLLSSSTLAPHIGPDQVAVFFPSWKEQDALAPAASEALAGD